MEVFLIRFLYLSTRENLKINVSVISKLVKDKNKIAHGDTVDEKH